jgi:hypothetical protein
MEIKCKTCDIRTWTKHLFLDISTTNIDKLAPRFTCASKPATQKSSDCCISHFGTWSGIICDFRTSLREILEAVVNCFTRQNLPTANRKLCFMNVVCIEFFCLQKTHNRTPFFRRTLHKLGCHSDY